MAGKNLLVNGKNNITARANALANIQNAIANRTTATNVNSVQTPNLPTPTVNSTNLNLKKAAQPVQTPIVQNNAMNNLNTKIVQPVQSTNVANVGVGSVAPMAQQQSRFIGFQTPKGKSVADIAKSALYIPTAGTTAGKENKREENKFRTTEQALLDFQADVLKKKGKMKDADIKRLYPEFADQLDVMKELQAELRPIVKNGQGVDGEQLAQYYPELIQPKNIQDVEAIRKQSEKDNQKLQKEIERMNKVVTENYDVLSPDGQKAAQYTLTLEGVIDSLKKNYRVVGGANDSEILQYAIDRNPELKGMVDELQNNLHLTNLDKKIIYGASGNILVDLLGGLQQMTREASTSVQNFAAEVNGSEGEDNIYTTTLNIAANVLGSADQATTASARVFGNQNVNYNITTNGKEQEAVEKQEVSDLLAMGGGYWKTVWGLLSAPFEYGKLNPITKPAVEGIVEPVFEGISKLEKTITNPVWNAAGFNEQDKENADAILLGEIFRESKVVKKDIKVRADAAKDIVSDAFKKTVKSNKWGNMKTEFEKAGVMENGYIKPEAKTQAAKIIAREFAKDFTKNFENNAKQWGDVVDFYRKKEGVKSYKEQINDLKEGAKNVVDSAKETGKKVGKNAAEIIDKGFDKMDETIENKINSVKNKVTKKQTTEIKAEEKSPIKEEAGRSQPKKGVIGKVTEGVSKIGTKIYDNTVEPIATKVAEGITSTTAPQDKLFKALNPSVNILSRKKGNYETIKQNSDRANELIIEYGRTPKNSAEYYDAIVNTKKDIWNNGIKQGLDTYKYTTIDAADLINPVKEAMREFTQEPLESLKGDVKLLMKELDAIESKRIISLEAMENKKQQINAILEYGLPPDASQIYEKGMRELNRQIGIQEDRMISELPGEFKKFKRDYGALTAIQDDAQKLMIKDAKKKLGGNLIQNWSRIEGLSKMGKSFAGKGSFLEGAAQIILGESLGKVKDTNFLIESGFNALRGQYGPAKGKPEGVKIKKKPPTPRLEDKRTDVEKGKLLEIDKRTKANREEGYKTKNAVTSEKSAVTEKKPTPKKEEVVEKKETPKAEKELETRVETKQPEPKQEPKNKVTAKNTVVTEENLDELLDGSGIDRTRNANIINNIKSFDDLKDLLKPAKAGAVSDWEYEGELNGVKTRVWNYGDTIFIKYGDGQGPAQARIDMTDKNYIDQLKELLSEINNDGEILESNRSNPFSTNTAVTSKKNAVTSKPEGIRTFEQDGKLASSDDLVEKLKSKELGRFQKFENGKAVLGLVNNFNESVISVADGDWQTAVQAYIMRDDKGEKLHFQLGENTTKESERIFNKILQDLKIGYIVGHKDDGTPTVLYKKTGHTDDMKYGRSFNGVALSKDYRLGDTDFTIQRNAAEQEAYNKKIEENRAENQRIKQKLAEEEQAEKEKKAQEEQALAEKRKGLQEFLDEQYENNLPKAKAKSELTKLNKDADRNSEIAYYEGFPENYNDMEIWELLDILGNLDKGEIREVREHGETYSYWFELNRRQNEKGRWTNDYRTHLNKYEKDYLDFVMGKKRVEADLAEEARDMKENPEKYASEEQLKSLFKEGGTTVKTQGENTENLVTDKAKITTKSDFYKNYIENRDETSRNGLLGRMKSDLDYIINQNLGTGGFRHLRAVNDPERQIQYMRELKDSLPDYDIDIDGYEKAIKEIQSVAKSENRNIIGKNNSLTTKNPTNDRNNETDIGKKDEGQTELSNSMSNAKANDGGRTRPVDQGAGTSGEKSVSASSNNISEHRAGLENGGSSEGVRKSIRTKGDDVITEKTVTQARDINRDCVDILEKHEFSSNPADYTKEEIETLKQYEGRGGINDKSDTETQGALNQYYTKDNIIKAMWRLLDGYSNTDILEPSMGVGRFFMYAPEGSNLAGFEYDKIPGTIAKILYPNADIKIGDFQDNFMLGNLSMGDNYRGKKYDIVIGNPPYEERQGRQKALGEEPKISRFDDYFIKRGVDMLKPGGHLAFVTSSQFLRGADNYAKGKISENAELIDAYRIPVGAFDRTGVETDIIVLRKKEGGGDRTLLSASKWFDEHPEKILGEERDDVMGRFGPKKAVVGDLGAIDEIAKTRVGTDGLPATLKSEFTPMKEVKDTKAEKPVTTKTIEAKEEKKTTPVKKFSDKDWKDWTEVKTKEDGTQETITWGKSLNGVVYKGKGGPTGRMAVGKGGVGKYQKLLNANGKIGDPTIKLESDREGLNYIAGELEPNLLYASGQIPLKLEQLEKDYEGGFIDEKQYNKQKDLLEQAIPQEIEYQNIYFSPYLDWIMDFPTNEIVSTRRNGQMVDEKAPIRTQFKKYIREKMDSYPNIVYKNSKGEDVTANAGRVMLDIVGKGNDFPASAKERVITLLPKEYNKFLKGPQLDTDTKARLQTEYNKKYNSYANFDYSELGYTVDDISETFMGDKFNTSDVQARGIARILTTESMIIAHGVGQGKTIEGIIGAIASMQQGKARKALVVIPAGTKASRMQTTAQLFPNQEMVDLGSLAKGTGIRKKLVDMYGPDPRDWIQDGQLVFLEHSAIGRQISFKRDTLTELEQNLTDVMESHFETERNIEDVKKQLERTDKDIERSREKGASAADLEKKQKKREELLGDIQKMGRTTENTLQDILNTYSDKGLPEDGIGKALELIDEDYDAFLNDMGEYLDHEINVGQAKIDKSKALEVAKDIFNNERAIYMEDLGIDHMTVDEAHNFRNLFNKSIQDDDDGGSYHAGMQTKEGSKQAKNLYAMSQYIMSKNGGGNVILLTATPFINDPSEMYNMLSYVGKNGMMEMGVTSMDDFYDNFVGLENKLTPTASTSGVTYKNVMIGFNNTETLVKNLLDRYIDYEGESLKIVKPRLITNVARLKMGEEQTEVENILEEQIDKNEFKDEWRGVPLMKKRKLNDRGEAKGAVLEGMQQANLNLICPYLTKYLKDKLPTLTWQEMLKSSPKLQMVVDIIKRQRDMGIMRGTFVYMDQGKELHEKLKTAIEESIPGIKVGIINGDKKYADLSASEAAKLGIEPEGARARQTAKKFSDGELDVLIGGANTKEGINLQGNGYHLIEVSQPRNMNDRTQLNGRMWRQGNLSNEVLDTLLLMENSSDIYRFELMARKEARWNILEQLAAYKRGEKVEDVVVEGQLDMNEEKLALFTDPEKKARVSITMEEADLKEQQAQTKGQISTIEKLIDLMSNWKNDYGRYRKLGEGVTRMDKLKDEDGKAITTDILADNALEPLEQQVDYAWNEAMKKMQEYNERRTDKWTKAEMEKNIRNNSPYSYEAVEWKNLRDKLQQARGERNLVIRQTDALGINTVEGLSDFILELEQQLRGINSKLEDVQSTFNDKVEMFKRQAEENKANEMDKETILKDLEEDFKHQTTLANKEELRNWIEVTKNLPKREQARNKAAVTGGKNKYSWNSKDYVGQKATFEKPKNLITSKYEAYSESNPKPEIKYIGYTPKEIIKTKDGNTLTRIGYQDQFQKMNNTLKAIKKKVVDTEEAKSYWRRDDVNEILGQNDYYNGLKTRLSNMILKFAQRYDNEIIKAYKSDNPGKTPTGPEDFYNYINNYSYAPSADKEIKVEDEYVKAGAEHLFKTYNEGKNNVLGTEKNKVTTQAARTSRPSIRMNVEEREKKNVVNPTKEVKPQVEQKDIKGKMYHVTTADFENFRESADYDEDERRDWNDSYGTYVTDAQQFFEDFMQTSPHQSYGDWKKYEIDVDIKKAALHPYRTWKEFGPDKADEMIVDWLQLVDRWTPEMQKELVAYKMMDTDPDFDYDSYDYKDSYTKDEILKMPGHISSAILDAQFVGEGDYIIDYLRGDHAAEDRETLKKKGYDAVMIYEGEKDGPIYSYALFYPNKYKKNVVANDKNKVTSNAMRAYRPQITMKLDDNGNPVKKNKITKQPVQNTPMKFSPELVSKIDKLAEERGLEGNTIKKMKVLNKEVDKGKGYQTETEKEIYALKKQIIIEYLKAKGKTIKDGGQDNTIVDIKQGKTRVHWHVVGKLYRDLKREGIIK